MSGQYKLVRPDEAMEGQYAEFLAEWGEGNGAIPYALQPRGRSWADILFDLRRWEVNPPEGLVKATGYAFVDGGGHLLGFIDLRHTLNDSLKKVGGHIGYGLRPAARGKGLAPVMLNLCLEEARALGLERVFVTCNRDNTPSARTILRCGGVPSGEYTGEDGVTVSQFWITL